MPHVKPVVHGDSGTRSQSPSFSHPDVQSPVLEGGNVEPIGRARWSGTARQVRDTQSNDGDATVVEPGCGGCNWQFSPPGQSPSLRQLLFMVTEHLPEIPRSQIRPTGLPVHAARRSASTT
jgi:hypothetical protein